MTKLTAAELRAMSEHYKFDEASISDMALTIGLEKTKAICDFVRSPERSTVQGPQTDAIITNGSVPGPNTHIPQVIDQAAKQPNQKTLNTGPQKNTETTNNHPKS